MPYIERSISEVLKKRVSQSKCTLITGARQVGKSTLIRHIFPDYNAVSFDDRLTRVQAKEEPGLFFMNNPCPLFIDEVQKESSVLEEIKLIADKSDDRGLFILSGSQRLELMKGISESLAGRVSISELSGLSAREINELIAADSITFTKFLTATAARTGELLNYSNYSVIINFNCICGYH